jgi:molecular chaperone IbpA
MNLTRFDMSSLNRAVLGCDRLFAEAERLMANNNMNTYPPYNVRKSSDDDYVIEIAVTGFNKEEITVKLEQQQLVVSATAVESNKKDPLAYLYRGLATRDFERRFTLSEYMQVDNATIENGLLSVYLKRVVPEALKPRTIAIK